MLLFGPCSGMPEEDLKADDALEALPVQPAYIFCAILRLLGSLGCHVEALQDSTDVLLAILACWGAGGRPKNMPFCIYVYILIHIYIFIYIYVRSHLSLSIYMYIYLTFYIHISNITRASDY